MGRLSGCVALVTGAGRQKGIGRASAVRLAQEGADVVISAVARDPSSFPEHERAAEWKGAASVAAEIEAMGRRALAIDCDVANRDQVERMIQETIRSFGRLDIVVNNAGLPSNAGESPIVDTDDAIWLRAVDVNLNGTYFVCKHAARAMIAAGNGGAIVNVSSIAGRVGFARYGAYSATKFALVGLTQQLALELAPHRIRVNTLCPGTTATDMMSGTFVRTADQAGLDVERVRRGALRAIPLGREGLPEEQAAAVAFLVGPDAAFITGQALNVDGGARMD